MLSPSRVLCCAHAVQVQKVSCELAEYKAESKAIKNQDLTIRKQEEAIRDLTAALEAKDKQLEEVRQQAAAEADAALLSKMQVGALGEQQPVQPCTTAQLDRCTQHWFWLYCTHNSARRGHLAAI